MARFDADELRSIRSELLEAHREVGRLRTQNESLIATNRDLGQQLAEATQSGGALLRTIVAFRLLTEAADEAAVLRGITDILVNIIGTEDFAVVMTTEGSETKVVGGMGPRFEKASASSPSLEGLLFVRDVVRPLHLGERVVGAIVIGSLLPHRERITAADEQVLALLSSFAATALMAANERRSWTRERLSEVA
jgi:hypothetical protein